MNDNPCLFTAHLNYLMEENDDSMIMPDEYIAMYEKPFDVTLESGMYNPRLLNIFHAQLNQA